MFTYTTKVALRGPLAELHFLAVRGGAQHHHPVGILGVVVVEAARGGECVVGPVAHYVAQLGLGHAPVQGQRGDDMDVVHPGGRGHLQHLLDDHLADVGAAHGGQRQGDVVERDGELHGPGVAGRGAGLGRWG